MSRIIIPCPVDMRRYLKDNEKCGICNLTSNYICDIPVAPNDAFRDTLSEVSRQIRQQKESRDCLKSIMMLEASFKLLPFWLLRRNFSKFFTIPVTSFTNLGVIDKAKCKFGDVDIRRLF